MPSAADTGFSWAPAQQWQPITERLFLWRQLNFWVEILDNTAPSQTRPAP
jgi:hypothetical protein